MPFLITLISKYDTTSTSLPPLSVLLKIIIVQQYSSLLWYVQCKIHLKSERMNYMMNLEKKIPLKLELKTNWARTN
jgi:hypothetical protein